MMGERELTRLSFLVDALVSAPAMSDRLTTQILSTDPPDELRQAIKSLQALFRAELDRSDQPLDVGRLRVIAETLLASEDRSNKFAGQALARAIENVNVASTRFRRTATAT